MLKSLRLLVAEHFRAWLLWGSVLVLDTIDVYERWAPDRMKAIVGDPTPLLVAVALLFLIVLPYHKLRVKADELQEELDSSYGAPNRLAIRSMRESGMELRSELLRHLGKAQPQIRWKEKDYEEWQARVESWERDCCERLESISPDFAAYFHKTDDGHIAEGNAHDIERNLEARLTRLYDLAPTSGAAVLG
jgi:hypothetical protein